MSGLALVMLGGALGGVARYALAGAVSRRFGQHFPWGTLAVNVTGAFAAGIAGALAAAGTFGAGVWLFAVIGFLGSYTTVSAFSLETLSLFERGEARKSALNAALSLGLCIGAAGAGFFAGGLAA